MANIPSLKFSAKLVCIQALFKHLDELDSDRISEYITSLLETDCFTAVSEDILHRITKYFPEKLTNRLLKALLPAHVKELNLMSCHNVTLMGLVDVLKKCCHLQKLNLSDCTQLMVPDIFTCMGLLGLQITTISVEGNQNVTDDIVQTMIKYLPSLRNLEISCCQKVTDDVFLVEKEIQSRRETSKQMLTCCLAQYKYKLSNVDISGCGGLTSVGVRHLTSLSGPHLRFVNIAFTKIDSTALFSLAGYSFPAIINFVINGNQNFEKEAELKEYLAKLNQIAAIYGIPVGVKGSGKDAQNESKSQLDESSSFTKQDSVSESNTENTIGEVEEARDVRPLPDELHVQNMNTSESNDQNTETLESKDQNTEISETNEMSETEDQKNEISETKDLNTEILETNDLNNEISETKDLNNEMSEIKDLNNEMIYCDKEMQRDSRVQSEEATVLETGTRKKMEALSLQDLDGDKNIVISESESFRVPSSPEISSEAAFETENRQELMDKGQTEPNFLIAQFSKTLIPDQDFVGVKANIEKDGNEDQFSDMTHDLKEKACDIKTDVNISSDHVLSVIEEKLVLSPDKLCLSTNNVDHIDGLQDSPLVSRTRSDLNGENQFQDDEKESNCSHSENEDFDFAITVIEECNQMGKCDDVEGVNSLEITPDDIHFEQTGGEPYKNEFVRHRLETDADNAYPEHISENCDDSSGDNDEFDDEKDEDLKNIVENNKTGETQLMNEIIFGQTNDECVGCERCNSIREKIKASKSAEGGLTGVNSTGIYHKVSALRTAETYLNASKGKGLDRSVSDSSVNYNKVESNTISDKNNENSRPEAGPDITEDLRAECKTDTGAVADELNAKDSKNNFIAEVSKKITEIEQSLENIDERLNIYRGIREEKETKDNLKSVDEKLDVFRQTGEHTVQLYIPHLTGLNIENIIFPSRLLGTLCLEKFFQMNKELRSFRANWKGISDKLMKTILPSLSKVQDLSLEECTWLQIGGVAAVGQGCPDLRTVNLRGVTFIKDMALVPYLFLSNLTSLDLAESEITDVTLKRLANRCSDRLTNLDLSWCEEVTEKGINEICCRCSKLEVLTLKKCPVSDITMSLMGENCRQLRELTIESAEDISENTLSDAGICEIGRNLRFLQKLDISWNLSITNVSISVIMSQCSLLEEAYMKGLKQITGEAFLPIIADYPQWQRCQALIKFKKQERKLLQETEQEQWSSDEEYESLMIPHRSTSYAPNLCVLDLEYSDLIEDEHMMEIVSVCRGSLKIIDYYGQELQPKLFIKK